MTAGQLFTMKGFINLIKPEGMSSAYAVGAVKKKLRVSCGHMGTLDPMASGVLPVGVGRATRLFPYLSDKRKVYRAKFRFGFSTDTLDVTGSTEKTAAHIPDEKEILAVIPEFTGVIKQVPPRYSAKCVNGKRGYQLARRGVDFTLAEKEVSVYGFELVGRTGEDEYEFLIECGGGTYIRSLARDLGVRCSSLAVMSALRRTRSGIFSDNDGVGVEEFVNSDAPEKYLIAPELTLDFPEIALTESEAKRILDGIFDYKVDKDGYYKVFCCREFWGVGEATDGILRIKTYVR